MIQNFMCASNLLKKQPWYMIQSKNIVDCSIIMVIPCQIIQGMHLLELGCWFTHTIKYGICLNFIPLFAIFVIGSEVIAL